LNKDELAKIAEVLQGKGELELLFALGYYTGARRGDCVLMKWGSNIDLGAHRIRYTPHKTAKGNKQITLTMAPRLYDLLEATPASRRKGYVLPELAEIYQRDPTILSRRTQQVFKDAGIETTEEVKGYGNKVARVGFHSLRHANITAMIEAGIPLDVVQRQAGHSTIGMTAHYHTISKEALQAASDAIPDMTSAKALTGLSKAKAELLAQIEGMNAAEIGALLKLAHVMERKRMKKTVGHSACAALPKSSGA
jgi:integrase